MIRPTAGVYAWFLIAGAVATLVAAQETPHGAVTSARVRLIEDAEGALTLGPFSVIQKPRVPPGGDKHDFVTLAPYWWPDPKKPNGLPYIRRDGEVNPESRQGTDAGPFGQMCSAASVLAEAYRETNDERFAARAALLLRTWFLDPATRMTPHLEYGQAVPGHNTGRGAGIITTRNLVRVVDVARMIAASPSWTGTDRKGLEAWCAAFADWLRTSRNGKEESAARNNHGTWYDAQLVALLLYTGQQAEARKVLEWQTTKRLAAQIEPDGRQPEELTRTRSWDYSVMNLEGWFTVARLAKEAGLDLWTIRTKDGRSMRAALDYLVSYASGTRKWPYRQITPFDTDGIVPLLRQAAEAWHAPAYGALADRLEAGRLRQTDR